MKQGVVILLLLLGNILIIMLMSPSGKALKTPATPAGILHLEFAADSTSAQNIINVWENSLDQANGSIPMAQKNIYLDFFFIPLYTALLFMACKFLFSRTRKRIGRIGMAAALVAGLGDIVENLGMLYNLEGNVSSVIAMLSCVAAIVKWSLVAGILLIIIYLAIRSKTGRVAKLTQPLHSNIHNK